MNSSIILNLSNLRSKVVTDSRRLASDGTLDADIGVGEILVRARCFLAVTAFRVFGSFPPDVTAIYSY